MRWTGNPGPESYGRERANLVPRPTNQLFIACRKQVWWHGKSHIKQDFLKIASTTTKSSVCTDPIQNVKCWPLKWAGGTSLYLLRSHSINRLPVARATSGKLKPCGHITRVKWVSPVHTANWLDTTTAETDSHTNTTTLQHTSQSHYNTTHTSHR